MPNTGYENSGDGFLKHKPTLLLFFFFEENIIPQYITGIAVKKTPHYAAFGCLLQTKQIQCKES